MTVAKPHRCTESCKCPACGSDMYYAAPTTSRLGEHACVDPGCAFAGGEREAMKQWMRAVGVRENLRNDRYEVTDVGRRIASYRVPEGG